MSLRSNVKVGRRSRKKTHLKNLFNSMNNLMVLIIIAAILQIDKGNFFKTHLRKNSTYKKKISLTGKLLGALFIFLKKGKQSST